MTPVETLIIVGSVIGGAAILGLLVWATYDVRMYYNGYWRKDMKEIWKSEQVVFCDLRLSAPCYLQDPLLVKAPYFPQLAPPTTPPDALVWIMYTSEFEKRGYFVGG